MPERLSLYGRHLAHLLGVFSGLLFLPQLMAGPIRFAGVDARLSLSVIDERIIEIRLASIDVNGREVTIPPSPVIVKVPRKLLWTGIQLEKPERFSVGNFQLTLASDPLSLQLSRHVQTPGPASVPKYHFEHFGPINLSTFM